MIRYLILYLHKPLCFKVVFGGRAHFVLDHIFKCLCINEEINVVLKLILVTSVSFMTCNLHKLLCFMVSFFVLEEVYCTFIFIEVAF